MNNKITNLIFIAILFCGFNSTVLSQPIEIIFTAATDTLTRAEVNAKLSEYDTDELEANGFIAIIDDGVTVIGNRAFAFCSNLKSINTPNIVGVDEGAFEDCKSLTTVDLPLVTFVSSWAFGNCKSLTTVNFPLVEFVSSGAFAYCENLTTVSFGTGFENPTTIGFLFGVFPYVWFPSSGLTQNIDLILGSNVLPLPDLEANTWQYCEGNIVPGSAVTPYKWKSITIHTNIEETIKNHTVNIYPNPTVSDFTVSFDLETAGNLTVTLNDILGQELFEIYNAFTVEGNFTKPFSLKELPIGVYYLKIVHNGNVRVEKVIRN